MATLTVKQSGGDYSTLGSALSSANASDTISIEGTWTVSDTAAATVADDNITIETDSSSKHPGYVDNSTNHYRLEAAHGGHALIVNNTGAIFDGLVIKQDQDGGSDEGFRLNTNITITLKNCILWAASGASQQDGIYAYGKVVTVNIENCEFYIFGRSGIFLNCVSHTVNVNVNSSSFWGMGSNGVTASYPGGGIAVRTHGSSNINVFNTISVENDYTYASDYMSYTDSETWNVHNSVDSDGTITDVDTGATGAIQNKTATDGGSPPANSVVFEDITTSPYDLRLVSHANNDAHDAHSATSGAGLSLPTLDIAGNTRETTSGNIDVGAHEVGGAAPADTSLVPRRRIRGALLQF